MSRYASNASGGLAASAMLDAIARKESSYKEGIKQNHVLCKTAASRLRKETGELEEILMLMTKDSSGSSSSIISEEEVKAFLEEQRGRLKKLAQQNVLRERTVDTFVSSVRQLQQQVGQEANTAQEQTEENANQDGTDYEACLKDLMDKEEKRLEPTRLQVGQEAYCREVMLELGEKDSFAKKKSDDDDEIEFIHNNTGSSVSLKCPVMGAFLVEPVKNKLCGHVFSKAGIEFHLKHGPARCPVAGCTNGKVTLEQFEADIESATLVRREMRRLEKADKAKASQATDLVDSDEE
jgi:hypothetical protein